MPLVEAMAHDLPVLAWPAGAVPYTLGGGGELLLDRSPSAVAAAMLRIAKDTAQRANMVTQQRKALKRFRLDRQVPHLIQALAQAGAAAPTQQEARQALTANLRFTVTGHLGGTYSLAAINRCLALSLEHHYPGAVRVAILGQRPGRRSVPGPARCGDTGRAIGFEAGASDGARSRN